MNCAFILEVSIFMVVETGFFWKVGAVSREDIQGS